MTTTIIPVPVHIRHQPPKCPKCKREENKITTCRHCGHEYKNDELGYLVFIVGMAVIISIVLLITFLLDWMIDCNIKNKCSLIDDALMEKINFLRKLRL